MVIADVLLGAVVLTVEGLAVAVTAKAVCVITAAVVVDCAPLASLAFRVHVPAVVEAV
jgi:hypothetical protein